MFGEPRRTFDRGEGIPDERFDLVLGFLAINAPGGLYLLEGERLGEESAAGIVVGSGLWPAPRFDVALRASGAGASEGVTGV